MSPEKKIDKFRETYDALREEIGKIIVGQTAIVDGTLNALFANGHVLLEGVPGLGKTLLVRTLSQVLDLFQPHPVHTRPHAGGCFGHQYGARNRRWQARV